MMIRSSKVGVKACAALLLTALTTIAFAKPGDLDTSWMGTGKFFHACGYDCYAEAALVNSAGVYLGGTEAGATGGYEYALIGLTNTGSSLFHVRYSHGYGSDSISGLTSDGSSAIYFAGATSNASDYENFGAANVVAGTGALGTWGIKQVAVTAFDNSDQAILRDASGNIFLGGFADNGTNFDFAVVKLSSAGTAVSTFGTAGKATISFGGVDAYIYAMAQDAVGAIYLVGNVGNGTSSDFAVAKIDPSTGALITSFGSSGKKLIDIGSGTTDRASAASFDPSGHLLMIGHTDAGGANFAAIKLDTSGNFVSNFGVGGKITHTFAVNSAQIGFSMAQDKLGHAYISIAGYNANAAGGGDFAVAEIDATGALMPSFGSGGVAVVDLGHDEFSSAIALDNSGHIYLAGGAVVSGTTHEFAAARLVADDAIFSGSFEIP